MVNLPWAETIKSRLNLRPHLPVRILPFPRRQRPAAPEASPLALVRLIEGEIIPRLLLAHETPARVSALIIVAPEITAAEVDAFARCVLDEEIDALVARVDAVLDRGFDVERVYIDLLSPVACALGRMWEDDLCSFTDVTIGLCRLQRVVYDLVDRSPPAHARSHGGVALFALTPGDQHVFGLVLVAEVFRRAGWRTTSAPGATADELADLVSRQAFDLIGFSMANAQWLEALPGLIARLRARSLNPNVRIMVGGRVFAERPERCREVGADATANDPRDAVEYASRLVEPARDVA